ncbi:hypothetical protein [Ornithinibacillus scapharcae]|uniref:hypothetical protein n=1 Tax=Ornithinibacillus scapharcae TaxID=1147159 RepID=UPI000225BCA4|nr:hypothetical protein [Ornithinibacillus scapharcae]
MEKKEKVNYYKATNTEELLYALKHKESHIIIQEDFKEEFMENTQLPLSENEQMGFHLGSNGTASIWGEVFFQIINRFGKGSLEQKKIDSLIRKYSIKNGMKMKFYCICANWIIKNYWS